jgi:hypothetical protein
MSTQERGRSFTSADDFIRASLQLDLVDERGGSAELLSNRVEIQRRPGTQRGERNGVTSLLYERGKSLPWSVV